MRQDSSVVGRKGPFITFISNGFCTAPVSVVLCVIFEALGESKRRKAIVVGGSKVCLIA